jgi:crossover junction endodeoxyribonuclease RuvC
MRILGIDPGSNATGFGVLERRGGSLVHVAHGTLVGGRGAALCDRLAELHRGMADVLARHGPDVVAVEQVFVAASPRAALVLGQARGAVLAAVGAAGLGVCEYAAAEVKRAVTGSGRADKRQVQRMVRRLLELERLPPADAADALALAIRHAHGSRLEQAGVVARPRPRPPWRGAALVVRRVHG